MAEYDNAYCGFIGDFNANTRSNNHRSGLELQSHCSYRNLCISDIVHADTESFTFLSEAHGTVAWLDHVVNTQSLNNTIERVWVDYQSVSSDHFTKGNRILFPLISLYLWSLEYKILTWQMLLYGIVMSELP